MSKWLDEPTEIDTEHSGLAIALRRAGKMKHWRGYVGIRPTHPLYGVDYGEESAALSDALKARLERPIGEFQFARSINILCGQGLKPTPDVVFDVHGGLTYAADKIAGRKDDKEKLWWFGFDCAHCDDLVPDRLALGLSHGVYRDSEYVMSEAKRLAEQLASIVKVPA